MDDQSNIPDECSADSAVRPAEGLVSEEELSVASGVSPLALRKLEENQWVKPEGRSNGTAYYSKESCEHVNSMMCSVQAQVVTDLQEAHQVALRSVPEKARRLSALGEGRFGTIDPREILTHPTFRDLLPIDEGVRESLTADMIRTGFLETEEVVLGWWPGLAAHPGVLTDGYTRVQAAIDAGIERIPYRVVKFPDEMAGLRYAMTVQTKRRPNKDYVIFRLIERHDDLMKRGRPRKEQKALPPGGGNFGRSASARRMADLVRSSARKVERVRTILRHGTADIQDAVKNGNMKINKAYNIVTKKPPVRRHFGKIKVTPWTLAVLEELGGSTEDHVEAAVRLYAAWLRREDRLTAENAEHAERSQRIQPLSH